MLPLVKAVIFDLDGTLIDTIHDLADSVNEVLKARNYPQHTIESYKYRVGDGIRILLERALPETLLFDEDDMDQITRDFNLYYHTHWKNHTKPYPGITNMLLSLQKHKIPLAILSNKPQHFTDLCANYFFPEDIFHLVFGARETYPKKPDPFSALLIADELKVSPHEVIYVGDTSIDMNTAINAGMYPVGVSWGFRSQKELIDAGAQIILNFPEELLLIILKQE